MKSILKIITMSILAHIILINTLKAQKVPITFEQGGFGTNWIWNTFENGPNSPIQIIANPSNSGINTSATCASITTMQIGQPWAGFESIHPGSLPAGPSAFGTFTLDSTNCMIKIMVYKSVISDVGIKFATAGNASTGEIKVPNTQINQWEELTFDFSSKIGEPSSTNIDQLIIFPDFQTRTTDNLCYVDNISIEGAIPSSNVNVKFAVQHTDSIPVYVFGNWNNWSNWPGTPMNFNSTSNVYEVLLPMPSNTAIEYLFVQGSNPAKEVLNPAWTCTNLNSTYTNRLTMLGNHDTTLCNMWEQCATCIPTGLHEVSRDEVRVYLDSQGITLFSTIKQFDAIEVIDITGKIVFATSMPQAVNRKIGITLNPHVFYFIHLKKDNKAYRIKAIF